jgi:hypothetical protein
MVDDGNRNPQEANDHQGGIRLRDPTKTLEQLSLKQL